MNGAQDEIPDAELVRRALAAGSRLELSALFAAIYERHELAVLQVCAAMLTMPADAEDAAHGAFEEAFRWLAAGRSLDHPERLRAWLRGIARNQCRRQWTRREAGTPLPRDEFSDKQVEEAASRQRLAQADHMLDTVAATFTETERELFRLVIREGLSGTALASRLAISPAMASRRTWEIIVKADKGFGALVLARDGRRYCPALALILDEAGWHGTDFTGLLRRRIVRHLGQCATCDDCSTCNRTRAQLVAVYAPVTVPVLVAGALRERVMRTIRTIADSRPFPGDGPPVGLPASLPPLTPPARQPTPALPNAHGYTWQGPVAHASRPSQHTARRFWRRLGAWAAIGVVLLIMVVIGYTSRGSQPPTSLAPVVLTAETTTCPHKTLVYALCFPDDTPAASAGANPLLSRLPQADTGGITQVVKQLSTEFDPPSATAIDFFAQEPDPSPLPPPQCFQGDGEVTADSLAGDSAVETVIAGNSWAELGIVPLTAAGAIQAREEYSGALTSSCDDIGLSGSGWSLTSAGAGAAGMTEFVLRDVGAVPPAYTGEGAITQYTQFKVAGNYYIYVTAFIQSVADQLATALADEQ